MEDEEENKRKKPFKAGPKGGRKHTPGRDHNRKSHSQKGKRFRRKAQQRRNELRAEAKRQWKLWDGLSEEQKRFREDLRPTLARPTDGDAS